MKFECPNCKKSGQVDASKVPESGVYATCPQCNEKFLIKREFPTDFEFEPAVQPISKVANVMPQQSSPTQQPQPTPKDKSTVASPKQETEHQSNGTLTRKQLYQAAVGKNVDYYLPIFERFDREGKTSASWNWAAFFISWIWCYYRRMDRIGSLFFMIAIVLGAMEKIDKENSIALPLLLLNILLFAGLGMYANAFYYNHINKKIRSLDLKDENDLYKESFSKMFKPNNAVFYIISGFIGLVVVGIIAAFAIPQFNTKEEAPAPPPNAIYDPSDGKYHPIPAPAPAAVVDAPATRPTLDEIYGDKLQPPPASKGDVFDQLAEEQKPDYSKMSDNELLAAAGRSQTTNNRKMSAEDRHLAQIYAKHPDADTILPKVQKWMASLPAATRGKYTNVLNNGTAQEVIELFDLYKSR